MAYKGKYTPKNKTKYKGDWSKITFRSLWERAVMRFADANPNITAWNSEEIIIPYICPTDRKRHRYFMDFYFEFKSGERYIIEVKPEAQTRPPTPGKRKTKRFITETMAYAKNDAKWKAATAFAEHNGIHFEIWTERSLRNMGIPVTTNKRKR